MHIYMYCRVFLKYISIYRYKRYKHAINHLITPLTYACERCEGSDDIIINKYTTELQIYLLIYYMYLLSVHKYVSGRRDNMRAQYQKA